MNACWAKHCGCEPEGGPSCSVHAAGEVKYDRIFHPYTCGLLDL